MSRVLVTGGSGQLGRRVVDELAPHHEVGVLDVSPPHREDVGYHRADVLEPAAVAAALRGYEAVVHLAALDAVVEAPEKAFFETNVQGSWHVLAAAEAAGARKVVLCSSVAALGLSAERPPEYLPVDEAHPCKPAHAYGLGKQVLEDMGRCFARRGAMRVICLRPALIVWPEIAHDVATRIAREDGGAPPPAATHDSWRALRERISPTRAFVGVHDAARCFRAAVEVENVDFDVLLVTAGRTLSPRPTVEICAERFGAPVPVADAQYFAADPCASAYDTRRADATLGWRARDRLEDLVDHALVAAGEVS